MSNQNPDITIVESKLESSEIFNKIILESSPDCLKILDTEGRLQFMNFNGLCLMEIDDFSMFKDQLWWDLWGKEHTSLVKSAVETALSGKATEFTAFCPTAKGTPKWWHVTVTPVGTPVNGIYQLLSISRDITVLKKAEQEISDLNNLLEEKVRTRTEELLEKNIALEKSNEELAIFNHIASHDLQEPLRKIQMFCRLILDSENNIGETHVHFNRILDATQRMRNLIDALHKFSVSKNTEVVFENCDLNAILSDVIEYAKDTIDEKRANIECGKLPVIKGSPILITQLFVNLFENALKYSKSDRPLHIKISSEVAASDALDIPIKKSTPEFHVIKIEDNGIGFENQYRHQIFQAFQRLHSKDKFAGTGIGLAICKTIVENHNGWIDACSNPDAGAVFVVYLPKN
jgi:PAS domain S-box-containing protein